MSPLLFDLDGTLVNSQGRLYRLFCRLCPECKMSYDEYWTIKRDRITQATMLKKYFGYGDDAVRDFHKTWLRHVEDENLMSEDFPVDGISFRLDRLSKVHDMYIVTARQRPELVERQIDGFGWTGFFKKLIVTRQLSSKCDAILGTIGDIQDGAVIGDTGEDVVAARELELKAIAVSWGVLSADVLREYKPDYLAERIEDLDNCPFI